MSEDGKAEALKRLFQSIETQDALKGKSNEELADLLRDHVWADFLLDSPQSDLVGEVMDRLRSEADLLAALKGLMAHPNSAKAWDAADQAIERAEGRKP